MEKREKLEIDIELKDLLWEFLRKWRIVVCCMLVAGVILGVMAYISDYKAAKAASVPKEPVVLLTAEMAVERLNIDELELVIAANQLKAQVDAKSKYISESTLMKINPFAEDRVSLEYLVLGENKTTAIHRYVAYIENGVLLEEDMYVNELISVSMDEENLIINVQILHTDAESCEKLASKVKVSLDNYTKELNANGISHELKLIGEKQSVVVDDTLHQFQIEYLEENIEDQNDLAKMKTEMNINQINAYLLLERDIFGRDNVEAETTEDNGQIGVESIKVSIDFKQILLGMVIGLVVAVAYIFAMYILTGRLRTAKEIENLYGARLLGEVHTNRMKKRAFGPVDEFIWKLEHGKEKQLSFEERIKLAAASIVIQCRKYEYNTVAINGSRVALLTSDMVKALVDCLENEGITVKVVGDLSLDAKALLATSEVGNTIFLEQKRYSTYKDLLKEMQVCGTNHIQVLGMVVVEE
ncbi:MAG: hypothetical protein IKB01_14370 [Lachnospiraceae bacterium]|nr:hypothetical protein [Lachnospiraceae bacterium]